MPARPVPRHLRAAHDLPQRDNPRSVGLGSEEPPSWLPEPAQDEWRAVVDACSRRPMWLQKVDRGALEMYVMARWTYREAAHDVAKRGPMVPARSSADGDALVKNPAVQIMRDSQAAARSWAVELALTPRSRSSIDLGFEDVDDNGILDDFD